VCVVLCCIDSPVKDAVCVCCVDSPVQDTVCAPVVRQDLFYLQVNDFCPRLGLFIQH